MAAIKKRSRGKQCCVPFCSSTQYLASGAASKIHFFHVPPAVLNDKRKRDRWCSLLKRKDGKDGFNMHKHTVICHEHFKHDDIKKCAWSGIGRCQLKAGVEPSVFQWQVDPVGRRPPTERVSKSSSTIGPVDSDNDTEHFDQAYLDQVNIQVVESSPETCHDCCVGNNNKCSECPGIISDISLPHPFTSPILAHDPTYLYHSLSLYIYIYMYI
jgi:hypothetical protein